jgi:OTU domain-containing protein 6
MSAESDEEAMARRHKKELKDLQSKMAAMKKSAPVSDKKRRKEILAEVDKMEKELQERHLVERSHLPTDAPETSGEGEVATPTNGVPFCVPLCVPLCVNFSETVPTESSAEITGVDEEEEEEDRPGQKLTRAQRRRVNKQAKVTQRLGDLKILDDTKPVQISARTAEKIKLKKILDDNNFKLVEVRSDGNCLYHSLIHQLRLNGILFSVSELRKKTAQYMEKYPDDFKPFLVHQDTGDPFTPQDFLQYLDDIVRTNAWGSQIELRAISADLRWPIRVLQAEGTDVLIGDEYLRETKIPLTIVYHRHELSLGEHYNSVTPK